MSNRRRPQRSSARPSMPPVRLGSHDLPVTKVRDPGDVVAIVPYLIGFDPAESIVIVALEGSRRRFGPCARLDLVDDADGPKHQVDYVATLIEHHSFDPVILVTYSDRCALADGVMHALLDRLAADGVEVVEAVRADGARWWSYLCEDAFCCPPDGSSYDVGSSRVAAEAVVAGLSRAPSRDALREGFEPDHGRQAALTDALKVYGVSPRLIPAALAPLVTPALADPDALTATQQAVLVCAVQDVEVRDAAWAMMTRDNAQDHFALWTHLVRAAPDPLMAAVGSLAAFAAWLAGRGVLASHGAERVLAVHPEYSMARLLIDLCEASVDPAAWSRVTGRLDTG